MSRRPCRTRRPAVSVALAVAVAVAVAVAGLAGCGSSSADGDADRGSGTAGSSRPASFALALGIDANDAEARAPLAGYDLVVVDGGETSAATVEALHDDGAQVLAYLSVGTVEPGRDWFAQAEEEGWLLDHWDDWDEWYAAVAEPGLRQVLVDEAESELAKGFDGLFLDNTDMVDGHPDQREGMQQLVADLDDAVGSDRLLFAQNGDPVANGIVEHLDGWNREDVSWTYDFDDEAYAPVSDEDHRAAVAALRDLHRRGLVVTATDYTDGSDAGAAEDARRSACEAGAVSFVSDIDLTRISDPPPSCDG